ncbi:MAG TPA: hypothetical protein VEV17_13640 [Bryobacteraceae bacterium]|nr:hypothetical protein [Bryobacteraceae bacterium]
MRPLANLFPLLLASVSLFGQYKADPAGAPPPELAVNIAQLMQKSGFRISNAGAPYCEIWFRATPPSGPATSEQNVTLPSIPFGALLGVIRFDGNGADRRAQPIKAGLYTLRYGILPMNGDHQGAAPQRDFLLLTPAADDQDTNATPNFDALVAMSRKASGTPHPAVLSFWKADTDSPGFSQQGDDWVLQAKLGDTPIAVILIGAASS